MAIELTRALAVAVSLVGLAAAALPSTAFGAATTIPLTSTGIKVIAAPGTHNRVSITYAVFDQGTDGFHVDAQYIEDTAGLAVAVGEGQICTQPIGSRTACVDTGTTAGIPNGSTGTGENPLIRLGDLADTLVSDNVGDLEVHGGPGADTMRGGSRPILVGAFEGEPADVITSSESFYGEAGNDVLKGNGQPDVLNGGRGNDRLDARDGARDDFIICGSGRDIAWVDKIDPKSVGCETVKVG